MNRYYFCYLSIFSLFAPWAVVPSKIPGGIGWGGFPFFFEWLTKYPGSLGINTEVFLGICCLVGVAVLPGVWALMHAKMVNKLFTTAVLTLYGAMLIAIIVRLDWMIYLVAGNIITEEPLFALELSWGAVLHTLPLITIIQRYRDP